MFPTRRGPPRSHSAWWGLLQSYPASAGQTYGWTARAFTLRRSRQFRFCSVWTTWRSSQLRLLVTTWNLKVLLTIILQNMAAMLCCLCNPLLPMRTVQLLESTCSVGTVRLNSFLIQVNRDSFQKQKIKTFPIIPLSNLGKSQNGEPVFKSNLDQLNVQ